MAGKRGYMLTIIFGLIVFTAPFYLGLSGEFTESPNIVFFIFGAIIIGAGIMMKRKMKKGNNRR